MKGFEIDLNSRYGLFLAVQFGRIFGQALNARIGQIVQIGIKVSEFAPVERVVRLNLIPSVETTVEKRGDRVHAGRVQIGLGGERVVVIEKDGDVALTEIRGRRLVTSGRRLFGGPELDVASVTVYDVKFAILYSVRTLRVVLFDIFRPMGLVTTGND